ncbi:MAG TPA: hypothetical protein VFY65_19545 [Longimicrobium sp.]|nr:hypothetical protein [Longimicrobium sp.]
MKRVRNLLSGVAMFAVLAFGVSAAWAQPARVDQGRPCAFEPDEDSCRDCCAWIGLDYVWDGGCGCL